MVPRPLRGVLGMVMCAGGVTLSAQPPARSTVDPAVPLVLSADVESIIHPVSAEYMIKTIERADAERAALLVFRLRTPGGLVDSTRQIVSRIIAASTPIAVFVAPSGSRAASAGFILVLSADVAAMAPGTHIGAAHPVSGTGEKVDEVMTKKAVSDVAAYVRTLATKRGRNVMLAEQAVSESRAFTEDEALNARPPLIDFLATDIGDLLRRLDGQSITRFDGSKVMLQTAGARVVPVEMDLRQRVLSAIAHPNIAYILLTLGTLGLTIELWNPGSILPGVVGALSLLLAFFAFQVLPVNYAGVLLMVLGLVLLVLEVKITSFGLLTIGGLISLMLGSMMLVDSSLPELRVSLRLIVPVTLSLAGILVFLVRLGVAAQMTRPQTGDAGMLHELGETITTVGPESEGQVRTHGEIWRAVATEPIAPGSPVRVTAIDGLVLTVRPEALVEAKSDTRSR